jgi:Gig2-like
MEARQSERMAAVQSFLNHRWAFESNGVRWFDPDRHALYPDRIRRRPPGTDSAGLGAHADPGTLDLWMTDAYQLAFRHLFDGTIEDHDPWDASHRTTGPQYPGSTMCSAFRTFQGWTALSDMNHDQGVLHAVPIPHAIAYLLLRPLLDDVADDDMCGVTVNQLFPINNTWHPLLLEALSPIPDVRVGDSVWWHCDIMHGVAPVENQQGWGNVMYIPAAPWCSRNEQYASTVRNAFLTGFSPTDFPDEHYESTWTNRFQPEQLNQIGRHGLALEP